ncbi:MAG TPA: glycosyltransferase [Opitutaceae bacterium]|nr:glycosyltransferase [Opitutaceae bacterium]
MKNGQDRILVVTPTLGESEFLQRTVASVEAQPVPLTHVICAPEKKRQALQNRFPRARVVPDAGKAGGIYGALNSALASAGADWEWFTYINDDDALLPGFGEVFRQHLAAGAADGVIYGDVELTDEHDRTIGLITVERNPAWIPALLQQGISPLMQQGTLFHREIVQRLKGFDTRYRLCADLDFWLRAHVAGAAFRYYPRRVAQFRVRSGQLSGNTSLTEQEQQEIVGRHLAFPISPLHKRVARWRYRACNLPRYLRRARSRGFQTSYQILQGKASS